jgi:UDP-N-acetylmuramoyl-tripeptide--D-alanyl-D-alanine ligase
VFPADDAYAAVWRQAAGTRRVVDFACRVGDGGDVPEHPEAAVVGRAYLDVGDTILHIDADGATTTVHLHAAGLHNARNATAAAAASLAAGLPAEAVRRGLEAFRPARGRSVRHAVGNGVVVIDDSYNANPDSMRAAIDLLATHAAPRLLVIGDMGEVGADGPRFHAEIGRHARDRGVEALYAIGDASRDAASAFGTAARHFDGIDPLIGAVRSWVDTAIGGAIVVKGSRFMRMERVVDALVAVDAATAAAEAH